MPIAETGRLPPTAMGAVGNAIRLRTARASPLFALITGHTMLLSHGRASHAPTLKDKITHPERVDLARDRLPECGWRFLSSMRREPRCAFYARAAALSMADRGRYCGILDGHSRSTCDQPRVGEDQEDRSPVAGRANVLVLPDLESRNLLPRPVFFSPARTPRYRACARVQSSPQPATQ